MNSENRALIFNLRFNIFTVAYLSGVWPTRRFEVTSFLEDDNLDFRTIADDAIPGDLVVDSSRNRFIFESLIGGVVTLLEDPWNDIASLVVPEYSTPSPGSAFLFRLTPNCNLYQHGRVELGLPETIVEYLSQKANYQLEETICGTGPTGLINPPINIIGSDPNLQPMEGQVEGIPGDRPDPLRGDEWINPVNGRRFIYGDFWEEAPCCGPMNILGSTGATPPVNGQTGGIIPDREIPREGDEWIDPSNGDRFIYQDGMWQLTICCVPGVTGPTGAMGAQGDTGPLGPRGDTGAQGDTGPQGAQGAMGTQGIQGEVGATGDVGPQGNQGAIGATGEMGVIGVTGSQGPQGETGAIGPQGEQGTRGFTGPQGVTGVQGAVGDQGDVGQDGFTGPTGLQGSQGPTGAEGFQGPTGLQGATGNQGDTGPQGVQGPTGSQGIQGDTGPQGVAGFTGVQGAVGPTGDICSPLFSVETATGATGPLTSGPIDIDCGETLRFFSEGNLFIEVTPGSANVQIEPNNIFSEMGDPNTTRPNGPDDPTRSATYLDVDTEIAYSWDTVNLTWVAIRGTFNIFRYGATGSFHNPSTFQSAIVRSKVDNNISVTRRASNETMIDGFVGYAYDINIPSDDDIFHMTLVDRAENLGIVGFFQTVVARFVFHWEDPEFAGNIEVVGATGSMGMTGMAGATGPTYLNPTILLHNYGNAAAPNYTSNTLQARSPNTPAGVPTSKVAYTVNSDRSLTVDIRMLDNPSNNQWYAVSFSF